MLVYLQALLLTLVTELSVLGVAMRLLGRPWRRPLVVLLVANLVTHPSMWLSFSHLGGAPIYRLLACEVVATCVEAAALRTWGRVRPGSLALALSVGANVASYWVGVWLL